MSEHTEQHRKASPRVIAVASGKGGVGKTFFSVHLAARAADAGKRVLLMDADLGLANVDVMLGISSAASIRDVVEEKTRLSEVLVHSGYGFDVLPGGSGLHTLTRLSPRQQQILLDELDVIGKNYDIVIIDTAAGIGENVLYFVSASESALIVLTPDPTSLTDAYALIKVLSRQRDMHRFMVAINQADEIDAQITFRRLLSVSDRYLDVHLDYMGHLPLSRDVRKTIQAQRLLGRDGSCPEAMQHILDAVLQQPRDASRGSGLQFFWEHSLSEALISEPSLAASTQRVNA